MAKRDKSTITLGSGKIYLAETADITAPSMILALCKDDNLLGNIKGGAALEYTAETYEEKDDMGLVSKMITTSEEALLKCGLITWNGETLQKLIDRCTTTTSQEGFRVTEIGGAAASQGKYYAIVFKHEDVKDGDVYVAIQGRNTAGVTLTFAADSGTLIEPEFKAMPHGTKGVLVTVLETLDSTSPAAEG